MNSDLDRLDRYDRAIFWLEAFRDFAAIAFFLSVVALVLL